MPLVISAADFRAIVRDGETRVIDGREYEFVAASPLEGRPDLVSVIIGPRTDGPTVPLAECFEIIWDNRTKRPAAEKRSTIELR